jgi:crotonobetainyl-CoA:carnitine CoA-transferase CaiB-like acyl-CoA transferase
MNRALEGVSVVALEQAVAAPFCTMRLADAGARVIKIERAEGDFARGYDAVVRGESAYFVWLNRGKESITLDLKAECDVALLGRMVAQADIFVQNLAPGAAARLGFESAALRARYPRLITCDISGYGEQGQWRDMKAYDLLVQCEAGLASVTGTSEAPGRVGVSAADICCGMNAHAAILEALYHRQRTGGGAGIATSLFDGLADWMTVPLLHYEFTGQAPARVGISHPSIAPYGNYRTRDSIDLVIAVQNEREWRRLCDIVLAAPELAEDPRFSSNVARCAHRPALDEVIRDTFLRLASADLRARLSAAKIAFGRVNAVADFATHPQLRRVSISAAGGSVSVPAPPCQWAGEGFEPRAVPGLNAQGRALRDEFGR